MDLVAARDIAGLRPSNANRRGAGAQDPLGVLNGLERCAGFRGWGLDAVDLVKVKDGKGFQDGALDDLRLARVLVGVRALPWLVEDAMRAVLALAYLPAPFCRLLVSDPVGGYLLHTKLLPFRRIQQHVLGMKKKLDTTKTVC